MSGLKERAELNGQPAELLDWHPERHRFLVQVAGEQLLLKAEHLRAMETSQVAWQSSERHLGDLPAALVQRIAMALPARIVAALSASSRALRLALWREAHGLWPCLLQRGHGPQALQLVRQVHPELTGPDVYRVARALKSLFQQSLELVQGGADQQSEGIQVVACPVARNLVPLGRRMRAE